MSSYLLLVSSSLISLTLSYYDPNCDFNCLTCIQPIEDNPFADYCEECESGYFKADDAGFNGCLDCQDNSVLAESLSYGADDVCVSCDDVTGCNECVPGYKLTSNSVTDINYCQCSNSNCEYDTITFEDVPIDQFPGYVGSVRSGYYGLSWYFNLDAFNIATLVSFIDPSTGSGADLFNDDDSYGNFFVLPSFSSSSFGFGTSGGVEFRMISLDTATLYDNNVDLVCTGKKNGNDAFEMVKTISSTEITRFTVDNGIVIDEFSCTPEDGVLLVDNVVVNFASVDNCDDNCNICQSPNDPVNSQCGQCQGGYILINTNGKEGCINCADEFGSNCLHCADGQGCQQCVQGYNRVQSDDNGLHYCECDNCN